MIEALVERTRRFSQEVEDLTFTFDGYIYNPLSYAWDLHERYLRAYVPYRPNILFLGMNPGPFGMAQTGIPFGEINAVRDWMAIEGSVGRPEREHPARPVKGFAIGRSEVSGRRLWSLMEHRFGTADRFFSHHAVMNYCPLVFMDSGKTGRNVVPEKLLKDERTALTACCNGYLDDIVSLMEPKSLVGIGQFAKKQLQGCTQRLHLPLAVTAILHPSPGSPLANSGWEEKVTRQLEEARLW